MSVSARRFRMKPPGDKPFIVEYLEVVAKEDIPALPASARTLIKKAIEERLTVDPIA